MIVEDSARDVEQIAHQRIAQRVPNRKPRFLGRHDAVVSEDGELLRDDRLLERQRLLKLLNRASAADEDLENSNPGRIPQRAEEARLEGLEFTDRARFAGLSA